MVTLKSSGPIDYIASLFVHKSCISPFHNQVSDEAVDSITTGILMSLISYKRRVSLGEMQYQTASWGNVHMRIRCTCTFTLMKGLCSKRQFSYLCTSSFRNLPPLLQASSGKCRPIPSIDTLHQPWINTPSTSQSTVNYFLYIGSKPHLTIK